MWKYTGKERPPFAEQPADGQESVWDYPRPPVLQADQRRVMVYFDELLIADSTSTIRVLETAGAPTYYIPADDIVGHEYLAPIDRRSICEWKGIATYCTFIDGEQSQNRLPACGWQYTNPSNAFAAIKDHYSFYPALLDCFIDDEKVTPQPGGFYGGWVTSQIVGPIKGEPGSEAW